MPSLSRIEIAGYAVLLVLAAVAGVRYLQGQARAEVPAAAPGPARAAIVRPAATEGVVVHVAGAVREPGVYRVRRGARVRDAVRRAGGATGEADLHAINLAARVEDAQQVVVPARAPEGQATVGADGPPAGPVRLSTATPEQLDALDGVGPALAQRIVQERTRRGGFASVDDLAEVPGIGPKRLEALRAAVVP